MQYSNQQLAFFEAVRNTTNDLALLATAGSGKTTTILEALKYINPSEKTGFFSFSNAIVKELQSRVPSYVKAQTLHSLGYSFIRAYNPKIKDFKVEENKYFSFAVNDLKATREESLSKKDYRMCFLVQDICAFARQTLTDFTDKEALMVMCAHFNIDFEDEGIDLAMKLLAKHAKNATTKYIDFVDMVYLPAVNPEMVAWRFKNIFLDEAQDTNRSQLQLIENVLSSRGGRLISVGDDYQCIYGFSGADVDAFKRIRERPNTITLPLSYTYRCPKSHVRVAKEVCEFIECPDDAPEGIERMGTWDEIREGDIVLSRVTRPLVNLYFSLIERGTKAIIVGKDIERGLLNLVDQLMDDGKTKTIEGLKFQMEQARKLKIQELEEDGVKFPREHFKYQILDERLMVISIIMKKLTLPSSLEAKVKEIFHENKKAAKLMTIHRAKGLENIRVFVVTKNNGEPMMPSKYASMDWEHRQERNLMFVARTRSKCDLIWVELSDAA